MIDTTIFIDKILEPTAFANQLIEFLFDKNNKIEITIYSKLQKEDKKHILLNDYSFILDLNEYRNIKNILEKYFKKNWGFIINDKHKGLFSFKMETFSIDCVDENDKAEKEQLLDSLILNKIINKYEVDEDDWIDPYYEK